MLGRVWYALFDVVLKIIASRHGSRIGTAAAFHALRLGNQVFLFLIQRQFPQLLEDDESAVACGERGEDVLVLITVHFLFRFGVMK